MTGPPVTTISGNDEKTVYISFHAFIIQIYRPKKFPLLHLEFRFPLLAIVISGQLEDL